MEHISKSLNIVMKNIMVKCMLNPENKDFYIKNLTKEKLEEYIEQYSKISPSAEEVLRTAYNEALNKINPEKVR